MKNQKQIHQKPIDHDVYLKYQCPKEDCGQQHWLTLKEAKTKNFKIVCHCETVFKTKQVDKILIKHKKFSTHNTEKVSIKIPVDLLESCVKILVSYGFDKAESQDLICKSYDKNPTSDSVQLIKNTLMSLEINNG